MKKIILMMVIAALVAVAGCTAPTPVNNHTGNQTGNRTLIIISDGMVIEQSECVARGVSDKVVVFHKIGCPACAIAVPRLEELANEIDYEFEFIEFPTDTDRAYEIGLMPAYVPTVLIHCKAYVGAKTKDEYRSLIEG